MDTKQKIIDALTESLSAADSQAIISYLEKETDFFTAPCSTVFHNNSEGGLAEHSWNVYTLLKEKVERFKRLMQLTDEEILTIRWHMILDPGVNFNYPYGYPYNASIKKYPFITLMQAADMEASQVVEHE